MSQFVVSARKYRPQRFDEVVGQEHVSKTLKNALQNDQLAHAFLFCGPRGVGKTTCARILAKVLNCDNRAADFEACNTCNSCTAFNDNASFNINELDAASNNSVEHIRALIEQVRFQPQQGQYKIFIIDEVHMLSQQAFNAFLKTLEEPPAYAIFILATTEKHKIIPTILSRCQIFDFKRIQIPRIVSHLQHICKEEGITADKEALHIIAQKADGALRDGLSIFDRMSSFAGGTITYDSVIENLNVLDYDYYFKVVDAMVTEDLAQVLLIFDEIFKKGFDPDIFINGLSEHLRNLLVCKDSKTLQLLDLSDGLKQQYQDQSKIVPASFILTALNIATDCDINYKMARHKRLHVEMAIIKMTYIGRAIDLAKQPVSQATIEKKNTESDSLGIKAPNKSKSEPIKNDGAVAQEIPNSTVLNTILQPNTEAPSLANTVIEQANTAIVNEPTSAIKNVGEEVSEKAIDTVPEAPSLANTAIEQAATPIVKEPNLEIKNVGEEVSEKTMNTVPETPSPANTAIEQASTSIVNEPTPAIKNVEEEVSEKAVNTVAPEAEAIKKERPKTTEIPLPKDAEEANKEATSIPGSLKRKDSKFALPSLTDIKIIKEEAPVVLESVPLELAPLQEAWAQFVLQIESPSVKQAFKSAVLKVKDELTIEVEVGSQMAKSLIQQERELVPYLRDTLKIPNIALEIAIDPEKVKDIIQPKKILTTRDKYELMRQKNPLVQDLSVRLGLKPDNG